MAQLLENIIKGCPDSNIVILFSRLLPELSLHLMHIFHHLSLLVVHGYDKASLFNINGILGLNITKHVIRCNVCYSGRSTCKRVRNYGVCRWIRNMGWMMWGWLVCRRASLSMIKLIIGGTINIDILRNVQEHRSGLSTDIQVIDLISSVLHIGAVWAR